MHRVYQALGAEIIPSILSDVPFLPSDFVAGYEESRIIWLTTRNIMNILELAVNAFVVLLGATVFIWAKPLASALNYWGAQRYVRFPEIEDATRRSQCWNRLEL